MVASTQHKTKFYRGVHPRVKEEIKKIARALCVSADEIALAFFQAAIQAVQAGKLELNPQPTTGRMTLFPDNKEPGWQYTQMSLLPSDASPIISTFIERKQRWQFAVTYRVPEETHAQIREIADEYMVGIGSVASYFLQWGLQEYYEGRLKLTPRALTIKQSLIFRGSPL